MIRRLATAALYDVSTRAVTFDYFRLLTRFGAQRVGLPASEDQ